MNCKSRYTIFLIECTKCKLQYVAKAETELSLKINNHREDVLKLSAIPADQHFAQRYNDFNTDAKFIIIEQRQNTKPLDKRLEPLRPKGLNNELN